MKRKVGGCSTTHSPLSWQRSENECFWNTQGSRGGGEGEESKGGRNKLSNERKEALSLQVALDPSRLHTVGVVICNLFQSKPNSVRLVS